MENSENAAAIVDREARANGIPIALARAVVRIESNWNAGMTGQAGEVGLMQIKHPTARGMGYGGSRAALYDPATNIRWGMRYLAGAYRLAGGDTCGTVMRYQGGHGARRMSPAARVYCGKALALIGKPDTPAAAALVRVASVSLATVRTSAGAATRTSTRSTWVIAPAKVAPVVSTVADRDAPATLASNAAPARVPAFAVSARMAAN